MGIQIGADPSQTNGAIEDTMEVPRVVSREALVESKLKAPTRDSFGFRIKLGEEGDDVAC